VKYALLLGVTAFTIAAGSPRVSESTLREDIERLVASSGAEVAVAFRTLDGKDEALVQPDVDFHAASTMKVPVMIELFRQARARILGLGDRIPVVNQFHSIVDGSPYALDPADDSDAEMYKQVGRRVSYRELCEAMITTSSNLAANILIERLGPRKIQLTTDMLGATGMHVMRGVEDTKAFQRGLNNTTTARALLTLMETIARGQAVDKAASADMVAVLKRQRFNDRIPAGLPAGTLVAHKTGEITRIQHDAAIVYAPRPFVLVVLVRGLDDQKKGSALIADITRAVYSASQDLTPHRTASNPMDTDDPTAALLSGLIRVDSSNPPGRTAPIDELLAARLEPLGFEVDIVPTPDPGKSHLIARLRGDGSRRPLLLDRNDILREIARVVDDPRVEVKLANPAAAPSSAKPSTEDTDLFRALKNEAQAAFQGAEVTPYLFQAGTDAGAWRSRGVPVYGIYPYPITADDLTRMHGNDERVRVESLRRGTEMIYRTIVDVAAR